jgi:hypothetical protein
MQKLPPSNTKVNLSSKLHTYKTLALKFWNMAAMPDTDHELLHGRWVGQKGAKALRCPTISNSASAGQFLRYREGG